MPDSPSARARTETTGAPSVVVEDAGLTYDGRALFEDLHLRLAAGEITALLGPSGVGKSSLLRLIAGLEDAATGRFGDGFGAPLAGRVAYMAQRDLLMPWRDLVGNVTIGDRLRGRRPDRTRAESLLDELGLGARLRDRPAALSGGMRQRVALARTLYEDRPVVLMDEPFSALDAITRHELQDLAAARLSGRTVLLVTHDPLEALRLGHAVLVMTGRPARLEAPLHPSGAPPRDPADPALLRRQAELLERLARARSETAAAA